MADSAQERTEEPTAERLRKARAEGRIPQSVEFTTVLAFGAVMITGLLTASDLWHWFTNQVAQGLSYRLDGGLTIDAMTHLLRVKWTEALGVSAPFFLAASMASIAGGLCISGWSFSPKALEFKWERLSPASGFKSLFSPKSGVNLLTGILKMTGVMLILWYYMRDQWPVCLTLVWATPMASVVKIGDLLFGVVARVTLVMAAIGLADAVYQKWQYRRDMRMTRQDVKDERKQQELPLLVRRRIVKMQVEMVRKRMLQEVPKADVVLTNPTHVAVALKYDSSAMRAPQVVAKGADLLSEKIKEIARAHGVPIVERRELARTLFKTVEVGQFIPEALYVAVAEVLAMIFRRRKKR
jgi:flagellar biosynthetic protein FlhB